MEPKIVRTKDELELCYMRLSERFMSIAKKYEEAKANADALRKENEELKAQNLLIRGDNAELLANADAYSFNLSNISANLEELRKENEELKEKVYFFARTFRYYADESFRFYEKHPLERETDETRAANAAKESEASHDR